jgi:hypothetical protein
MTKAIIARRKGDEYQARVYWIHLLQLRTGDYVKSVTIESDLVSFVDDVVVEYALPVNDPLTGDKIAYRLIQCKYHMNQTGSFTAALLMDKEFIHAKDSLLQRSFKAFTSLKANGGFLLCVQSNWTWHPDDELAKHLHEGGIRDSLFKAGPKTEAGKVRKQMRAHLGIDDAELQSFLSRLRFDLGKNLQHLSELLNAQLRIAELLPIDPTSTQVIYDDLAWKLFAQGKKVFNRASFDQLIREENLLAPPRMSESEISIKSFPQFARRPADVQSARLDLTPLFEGRIIGHGKSWEHNVFPEVRDFLLAERLHRLPQPIRLYLDCHLSIAFLAGHVLDPKFGTRIIPMNKSRRKGFEAWPPAAHQNQPMWRTKQNGTITSEVVLAISVTHPIGGHLEDYLRQSGMVGIPEIEFEPSRGIGSEVISDAEYAWNLGYELSSSLRRLLPGSCHSAHIFMSVPASMAFILGNTLRWITRKVQLYEHDFEGKNAVARYSPSITIPN